MAQGFLPVTKKELLETGVSVCWSHRVIPWQCCRSRIGGAPRTLCGLESPNWHFW